MVVVKRVAITGTISSGKSTVLNYFKSSGAYTVDTDSLLHDSFSITTPLGKRIRELFGPMCILPNGRVDREYVSRLVAKDFEKLKELEMICHPFVEQKLKELYNNCQNQKEKITLFVVEVPLLFECTCPLKEWFDVICLVVSDREESKRRFLAQGKPEEEFTWRIARQLSSEEKKKHSHYVLENNGSLVELFQKTKQLITLLSV